MSCNPNSDRARPMAPGSFSLRRLGLSASPPVSPLQCRKEAAANAASMDEWVDLAALTDVPDVGVLRPLSDNSSAAGPSAAGGSVRHSRCDDCRSQSSFSELSFGFGLTLESFEEPFLATEPPATAAPPKQLKTVREHGDCCWAEFLTGWQCENCASKNSNAPCAGTWRKDQIDLTAPNA